MSNDIEPFKQEFLAYLTVLVFSSPETLTDKIPATFQETKLNNLKIKSVNGKILFINRKNKDACDLTKNGLENYGLSIEGFRKGIESIKKEKTLLEAIEKILTFHNKKLCEIYIPQAILAYTNLCEKFKLANPKKNSEEINVLLYDYCLKDVNSVELCYNYLSFTIAYQYSDLDTTHLLETIPFNSTTLSAKDTCLNILNAVKDIQRTSYRNTYINLINSIDELTSLQIKDKTASNILISELKSLTNSCFSHLIQATFYEAPEKFVREKEITKKFQNDCNQLITIYQNEHPGEFKKQRGILDRILWLIGKLIPSPILSKEKKMTLFGNKAINNTKKITEINAQLDQLATLNYFSRICKC